MTSAFSCLDEQGQSQDKWTKIKTRNKKGRIEHWRKQGKVKDDDFHPRLLVVSFVSSFCMCLVFVLVFLVSSTCQGEDTKRSDGRSRTTSFNFCSRPYVFCLYFSFVFASSFAFVLVVMPCSCQGNIHKGKETK